MKEGHPGGSWGGVAHAVDAEPGTWATARCGTRVRATADDWKPPVSQVPPYRPLDNPAGLCAHCIRLTKDPAMDTITDPADMIVNWLQGGDATGKELAGISGTPIGKIGELLARLEDAGRIVPVRTPGDFTRWKLAPESSEESCV